MLKVAVVLGTRPEIIKSSPVIMALRNAGSVQLDVIHTGQHYDYEMSQIFFDELQLPSPSYTLGIGSGTHGQQLGRLVPRIEKALFTIEPDCVLVQGDTNTALGGALAGSKLDIPVGHIEAGCRSFDGSMPEERNRLCIDAISSILFAPSRVSAMNLYFEGKSTDRVFLVGNTQVDVVEYAMRRSISDIRKNRAPSDYLVLTIHRPETLKGDRLSQILDSLILLDTPVKFPVHPRTLQFMKRTGLLSHAKNKTNILLEPPLGYKAFLRSMMEARFVVTDSGGVQEEASIMGTPCVTTRETTEWPETVWAGGNILVGCDKQRVLNTCSRLLSSPALLDKMSDAHCPFDGGAGEAIRSILIELYEKDLLSAERPNMLDLGYPLPRLARCGSDRETPFWSLSFGDDGRCRMPFDDSIDFKVVRSFLPWNEQMEPVKKK